MEQGGVLANRVAALAADREHGATELAREGLLILRAAACAGFHAAELKDLGGQIVAAKPTMAAVKNAVRHAVTQLSETGRTDAAIAACDEAVTWLERSSATLVTAAAAAIPQAATLVTCSFSSTVAAACIAAHESGKEPTVWALESRVGPGSYGKQLSEVLVRAGLHCTVLPDTDVVRAASNAAMAVVGADRVLPSGALVNGAPTLLLAHACSEAATPFLVFCETFKLDDAAEVEPGFDLIPPGLITAYVTESGTARPEEVWALHEG